MVGKQKAENKFKNELAATWSQIEECINFVSSYEDSWHYYDKVGDIPPLSNPVELMVGKQSPPPTQNQAVGLIQPEPNLSDINNEQKPATLSPITSNHQGGLLDVTPRKITQKIENEVKSSAVFGRTEEVSENNLYEAYTDGGGGDDRLAVGVGSDRVTSDGGGLTWVSCSGGGRDVSDGGGRALRGDGGGESSVSQDGDEDGPCLYVDRCDSSENGMGLDMIQSDGAVGSKTTRSEVRGCAKGQLYQKSEGAHRKFDGRVNVHERVKSMEQKIKRESELNSLTSGRVTKRVVDVRKQAGGERLSPLRKLNRGPINSRVKLVHLEGVREGTGTPSSPKRVFQGFPTSLLDGGNKIDVLELKANQKIKLASKEVPCQTG